MKRHCEDDEGGRGNLTFINGLLHSVRNDGTVHTQLLFFKHLYLFGMAYDLKYLAGGLAYRIYLKN